MNELPKISYSKKSLYEWCPRQYEFQYISRVRPDRPKRLSPIVGQAIHACINKMYLNLRFDRAYLQTIWPAHFYGYTKREGFTFLNKAQEERWLKAGESILDKFYWLAAENGMLISPIKTEWRFELPVKNDKGEILFLLKGVIDLVIKVGDEIWIIDFKTGFYKVTEKELSEDAQLTFYSMAVRQLLGLIETKVGFFYPRHNLISPSTRTEIDYAKAIEEAMRVLKGIEEKKFEPTYVKCHLCDYQERCLATDRANRTGLDPRWFYREPQ